MTRLSTVLLSASALALYTLAGACEYPAVASGWASHQRELKSQPDSAAARRSRNTIWWGRPLRRAVSTSSR